MYVGWCVCVGGWYLCVGRCGCCVCCVGSCIDFRGVVFVFLRILCVEGFLYKVYLFLWDIQYCCFMLLGFVF